MVQAPSGHALYGVLGPSLVPGGEIWWLWADPGNILFTCVECLREKSIWWNETWGDFCCGDAEEMGKIDSWKSLNSSFSMFWCKNVKPDAAASFL